MLSQSIDVVVGGKGGTKLQVLISKLHYKKCARDRLCGVWCIWCVWCVYTKHKPCSHNITKQVPRPT